MTRNQERPFDHLRAELRDISPHSQLKHSTHHDDRPAQLRVDTSRQQRTGIPEVVYAERKTPETVVAALRIQAEATGRALASRCSPELARWAMTHLDDGEYVVTHDEVSRTIALRRRGEPVTVRGHVGVVAAGTSDAPFAAEAAVMAEEMDARVTRITDVGVAGLHRLVRPLEALIADGVDAIVVAAGMDGALPSVIAGLVDVPIIGLPTSVGYGFGGGGVGALTAMLQSCAPGLAVVNIDNGIGAGAMAALIARRAADGPALRRDNSALNEEHLPPSAID